MIRIHLVVEGRTEAPFGKDLLAPWLAQSGGYLYPHMVGSRGGDLRYPRVKRDILGLLRNDRTALVSTMFDLYRLSKTFPGMDSPPPATGAERVDRIERALADDIAGELGPGFDRGRFIPYIQLHEFEAVLFSVPRVLAESFEQPQPADDFERIRASVATPEEIDEGAETAPSKRIIQLHPPYKAQKPVLALRAAAAIGLPAIRKCCSHFNAWLSALEDKSGPDVPRSGAA